MMVRSESLPAQRQPPDEPRQPHDIAATIRRVVLGHPAVERLDGGHFGVVATPAPGRRLVGVRVTGENQPVEIGIVARLGRPLPEVAGELRVLVRRIAGNVAVDVAINDVVPADAPERPPGTTGPASRHGREAAHDDG